MASISPAIPIPIPRGWATPERRALLKLRRKPLESYSSNIDLIDYIEELELALATANFVAGAIHFETCRLLREVA